jgi:predicted acylesterase/phospholipase RssA
VDAAKPTEDALMKRFQVLCLVAALGVSGCATVPREEAPPSLINTAAPVGFPPTVRDLSLDRRAFAARFDSMLHGVRWAATDGTLDILALSGGGAEGAFGAGALVGLTQSGKRPQFEVVTGVSTGAIIAPYAFLGPDWDPTLTDAFTGGRSQRLSEASVVGGLFHLLAHSSVVDERALADLVDHYVTEELIQAVARESLRGRLLWVVTTDLDREEAVVWDMGAIAAHGGEKARELFRDVIVASASVPGVFPPVLIRVEDAGKRYAEMHVDGGTSVPFFIATEVAQTLPQGLDGLKGANVYVLINGQLFATPHTTPPSTIPIVSRAFSTSQKHASRTALQLTAALAHRYGMNFRYSYVPTDYPGKGPLDFDTPTMQALFNYGERCAREGKLWLTPEQALARAAAKAPTPGKETDCPLNAMALHPNAPEKASAAR